MNEMMTEETIKKKGCIVEEREGIMHSWIEPPLLTEGPQLSLTMVLSTSSSSLPISSIFAHPQHHY